MTWEELKQKAKEMGDMNTRINANDYEGVRMNDRLKFRAWYEGRYIYKDLCDSNYYTEDGKCIGLANTLPNDLPWEQCTGLKDKNGKLIYDRDILGYFDNKIAVIYDNELPSFRLCGVDGSLYGQLSQEYVDSFGFKIVGNIHEVKEEQ